MTVDIPSDFSGVVSVRRGDDVEFEQAYGLADRAHGIPVTVTTRFAIASATKGFTALAVAALVADGSLGRNDRVRPILGTDLPLIADEVTVGMLLTHTSGIGDYVDEDLEDEEPLRVPVQALDSTEAYLPALDGFPAKFAAGTRFSYCNSGFVVLALVAERVSGLPFEQLLRERVWQPAGTASTGFLRSDELPGDAAIGYLDDGRTNVFSLPVMGSGDGGAYSTVADLHTFWTSLLAGRIMGADVARELLSPQVDETGHPFRYGTGFWLARSGPVVMLDGCDHGTSMRSYHDPSTGRTATVLANTTYGAAPIARSLGESMAP